MSLLKETSLLDQENEQNPISKEESNIVDSNSQEMSEGGQILQNDHFQSVESIEKMSEICSEFSNQV